MYEVKSFLSSFTISDASGNMMFTLFSVSRIVVVTIKKNNSMNTMSESEPEGGCGTVLFSLFLNFDMSLSPITF
jgi:hypothetical protein